MKLHWKASVAALMLSTMSLVAACGGSTAPAAKETAKPAEPPKEVTLRVATWDNGDGIKGHEEIVKQFQAKYPHIKIQLESVPDNYTTKLLTQFGANNAPDIFQIGDGDARFFVEKGVVEDISSAGIDKSIYYPLVYETGVVNGKLYYVTKDYSNLVMFYNKKAFTEAGVPLPTDKWTWDDFLAAAKKLSKPADKKWGIDLGSIGRSTEPWIYQAGGTFMTQDGKFAGALDSDATVAGVKFFVDMIREHKVAPAPADRDAMKGVDLFQAGHVAMKPYGTWNVDKWKKTPNFEFGVVRLPAGKAGSFNVINWAGFGVYSKSPNKKEAIEFLKFMTGEQGALEFGKRGLPAVKSAAEKLGLAGDPVYKVFLDELANLKPYASSTSPYYNQSGDKALKAAMNELILKGGDVKAKLTEAAQKAEKDLKEAAGK